MQKNSNNFTLAIVAIALVVFSLAVVFSSENSNINVNDSDSNPDITVQSPDLEDYQPVLNEEDWTKGNKDAQIVLYEFSDMQCPACAVYHERIIKPFMEKHSDEVLLVFRHYPLESIHPDAVKAGVAVEAAGKQGKFFEMQDMMFESQDEWSRNSNMETKFISYATELGLDLQEFQADLDSLELNTKVDSYFESLSAQGFSYTPTFFLNGELLEGVGTLEELEEKAGLI